MKPWRLQTDREVRARSRSRPGLEPLEGRTLLSTVKASSANPPALPTRTFVPYDLNTTVSSPTAGGGSDQIFEKDVAVSGNTHALSVVWLAVGLKPGYFLNVTQANIQGQYTFVVPVGYGKTVLQLFAEDALSNYSNIQQLTVNRGNPIEAWDAIALQAIQAEGLAAPEAARDLAVLHEAQYDAVAGITDPGSAYQVHLAAPEGASAEAAANSSAFAVLTDLFPSQASTFGSAEASAIVGLGDSPATSSGVNFGTEVANQTLANRVDDGSSIAPSGSTDLTPQYAQIRPFAIASPSTFRPAAPPSVGSSTYDEALAQVSALGRLNSTTRTPSQTAAALFWNEGVGAGSATDPAHWNAIAEQVTIGRKDSLLNDARLFAELDFAMADAGIASSDAQATFEEPRPLAAIAPDDPTFVPLLTTPTSPSYVSDHAAYASAAAEVLTSNLGGDVKFTDDSESALGLGRSFDSFDAAATEDGNSRVWGGVNFSFDVQAGDALGTKVGQATLAAFSKPK